MSETEARNRAEMIRREIESGYNRQKYTLAIDLDETIVYFAEVRERLLINSNYIRWFRTRMS